MDVQMGKRHSLDRFQITYMAATKLYHTLPTAVPHALRSLLTGRAALSIMGGVDNGACWKAGILVPELPEVETIVRKLNAGLPMEQGRPAYPPLPGRTVLAVRADWPRQIYPSVRALKRRLPGHRIESIARRGKYLVFELQAGKIAGGQDSRRAIRQEGKTAAYLLIHLKMSGRLDVLPADWPANKHDHVIFKLDNGYDLRFNDARKFGRVCLVDDPREITGQLGPEPLDRTFTLEVLRALLAGKSGALKPLLLDQTFIAGVGNIYADEALWRARLHPQRKASSLLPDEVTRLYRGIRAALRDGIKHEGSAIDWVYPEGNYQTYFRVYGRTGQACRRCGTAIERIVIGQRSTHVCPQCQVEDRTPSR
jgi:formamidopyrimidine-DNA glycosylase